MTAATRRRLAEVFGTNPHGPVYILDMGSWRHCICRLCEEGAVINRDRRGQILAFRRQHQAEWGEQL